ncbi:MAG: methyl-accepting chemotaxis protein [Oscillatoria sp. PMC 1051.18]|nr:methyl-accepting chemotaxis protein [Oscillatoria sp. PMC 1050.18]MEC5032738.1 methyl-accepting chemotaxis protein [Oscillatoria sp. PMC 1051.18]
MTQVIARLRLIVIVLFIFALFNLVTIYTQIKTMTNDSRIINLAGVVRGNSQRVVKLELLRQDSREQILAIEEIIEGLLVGVPDIDLVKTSNEDFLTKMREVKQQWLELEAILQTGNITPENSNELWQASEVFWELTNEAVAAAEAFAKANVIKTENLAILMFIFHLFILTIIWLILRKIASRLQRTTSTIASTSTEIASTVTEQERVATQQATACNELAITMENLGESSGNCTQQAQAAASAAQAALELSDRGSKAVEHSLEKMSELKEKVGAIAEQILHLSEQTNQIGNISLLVSDLANQTNMLALNAAVEAVRAGEQGKGFGVVASEIRKLADQSKQSANKINTLVADIQNAINSTVMVTDEGTKTVETGVEIARQTADAFAGVADAVNNMVLSNQQILFNIRQQAGAIEQVWQTTNDINQGAKETATGISQTKFGTERLNQIALALKEMI